MTDLPESNHEQQTTSVPPAGMPRGKEMDLSQNDLPEVPPHDSDPSDVEIAADDRNSQLFPSQQCKSLEREWQTIQANFVDSPRSSVQAADALVTRTIDTLASSFGEMRSSLERTWERDGDVSTEELRLALRNYRSFFRRLLSI
jgi:hypothetical protein